MLSRRLKVVVKPTEVAPPGQQQWTSPGTYSFMVPEGVTEISAVVIAGGGGGRSHFI